MSRIELSHKGKTVFAYTFAQLLAFTYAHGKSSFTRDGSIFEIRVIYKSKTPPETEEDRTTAGD